ncbi:MAG: hypothetical protein ACREKE_02915 [bacterium]
MLLTFLGALPDLAGTEAVVVLAETRTGAPVTAPRGIGVADGAFVSVKAEVVTGVVAASAALAAAKGAPCIARTKAKVKGARITIFGR